MRNREVQHDRRAKEGRVIFTSIPKSGTNWLYHILKLPRGIVSATSSESTVYKHIKKERIAKGHIYPTPKIIEAAMRHDVRIFLYRDPRDTIVSWYHHCEDRAFITHAFFPWTKHDYDSAPDKMMHIIESLKPFYDGMMKWMRHATHVLKYDAVKIIPRVELAPVCDVLGVDIEEAMQRWPKRARMFRTGNMDNWKYEWSEKHKEAYERIWNSQKEDV